MLLLTVVLSLLTGAEIPRPGAQLQAEEQRSVATEVAVAPDPGATYRFLESKARRVTAKIGAVTTTADRAADGRIAAQLLDSGSGELAKLTTETERIVRFEKQGQTALRIAVQPGVRPTLDWMSLQAHALLKDNGSEHEWRDGFLRGKVAQSLYLDEISVEFEGELVATTVSNEEGFATSLTSKGTELGRMKWLSRDEVLAWQFPGLTEGFVTPQRLKVVGGMTRKPTMTWAGIQALAFYEFHSLMKTKGRVADQGWIDRILGAIVPTLHANEPGCDSMHWLDESIYRPCCDRHDTCYAQSGCSGWSWFFLAVWPSWMCSSCNQQAVVCFAGGGGYHGPFYVTP